MSQQQLRLANGVVALVHVLASRRGLLRVQSQRLQAPGVATSASRTHRAQIVGSWETKIPANKVANASPNTATKRATVVGDFF